VIEAVPSGWFSNSFRLQQAHGTVAEINLSGWREKAEFAIQGGSYRLYREGFASGAFVLEGQGQTLARAWKPSALRARFELEFPGHTFTMRRTGMGRGFGVFAGERQVGSIRRAGLFTRRTIIDLPADWPPAAQVFAFWLALIIWRREESSGG
jgi:hypothetical protein